MKNDDLILYNGIAFASENVDITSRIIKSLGVPIAKQRIKKDQKKLLSLRKMQQNKSIDDIAKLLNGKASKKGLFVYRINSLKNASDGDISFILTIN